MSDHAKIVVESYLDYEVNKAADKIWDWADEHAEFDYSDIRYEMNTLINELIRAAETRQLARSIEAMRTEFADKRARR